MPHMQKGERPPEPQTKSRIMSDILRELSRPFPSKYVHGNPSGGGTYVGHEVITQRLLQLCGPFSFEVAQVIRGHVPEIPAGSGTSKRAKEGRPALTEAVVGIIGRLTVEIDGRTVSVEEAGDCEDPHNWPHDGARMKDACSDSIKRCAMRIGLGIHLWAQDEFFLFDELSKESQAEPPTGQPATGGQGSDVSAKSQSGATAPKPVGGQGSATPAPTGSPTWYEEAVKKHGAQKVKEVATAFSKSGAKVTRLDQLDAATEEQRTEVLSALADLDWTAPKQEALQG